MVKAILKHYLEIWTARPIRLSGTKSDVRKSVESNLEVAKNGYIFKKLRF